MTERDHIDGHIEPFARALTDAGLRVKAVRDATTADVEALGSSWAKRLGIPRQRPARLLVARA